MKKQVQNAAVGTLRAIAAPAHIAVVGATAIVTATGMAIANGIATGEGYLNEKIDGTDRENVKERRVQYTMDKMKLVADKAAEIKLAAAKRHAEYNEKLAKKRCEIAEKSTAKVIQLRSSLAEFIKPQPAPSVVPPVVKQDEATSEMMNEFRIRDLQGKRLELQNAKAIDHGAINAINREIGKLRKNTGEKLPTVSAEAAFASA